MLRILAALFLAMLPASLNARVGARSIDHGTVCAGTLEKSLYSNYYNIGGGVCSVRPGKASKAILAVCQEGDTCAVHAFGEFDRTDLYIERVISVRKLCTATDGTTFPSFSGCP